MRFLDTALPLLESHPHAWRSVQRIAALPLLGDLLSAPLWHADAPLDLDPWIDWGSAQNRAGQKLVDLIGQTETGRTGRFESDVVLTRPWSLERLAGAIGHIGVGQPWGPWQAQADHSVIYLEPLDLFVVDAGNHSFAAGVLLNQGEFHADLTEDHRPVYPWVQLTNEGYVRSSDGHPLGMVAHWAQAALFELGRWRLTQTPPASGNHGGERG